MKSGRRGGPADFDARLSRVDELSATGSEAASAPLRLLGCVLRHQRERAGDTAVAAAAQRAAAGAVDRLAARRFPLFDLEALVGPIATGIIPAVEALTTPEGALPDPLGAVGRALASVGPGDREALAEAWLDDPAAPDPRFSFWALVAAAPVLEPARAAVRTPRRDEWTGATCPACGGLPQASVIAEESGEFMGGSPRSLVCGRCAGWWTFPRATCPACGEDDPRRLAPFVPDGRRAVRIDACETCRSYIKTFDLRAPGAAGIVPLVDDVATLTLDVWASGEGLRRAALSLAGV